jgi:hypothetical protein
MRETAGSRLMRPSPTTTASGDSPRAPDDPLDRAVARWTSRGYMLTYRDAYLVQLARHEDLRRVAAPLLASVCGVVVLVTALRWLLSAFGRPPWDVVTLTLDPDGRIIMHSQRTWRSPSR